MPPVPGIDDKNDGGGGGDPGILKDVTASGRCKCVGDDACGGGRIYEICVNTQKDCKKAQKDVDDFCNNNAEMKENCRRPKCYYRHSKPTCPDECTPGEITPLAIDPAGPGSCPPVPPGGSPTVNKPASKNSFRPTINNGSVQWDVNSIDAANWGVCVTALNLAGVININPWPSLPNQMVVRNTANPVDGGNINNTPGSLNHFQYAIDDMADYDTAGVGGAGKHWHATTASEAHEGAHWEQDFKADSVMSSAGGEWNTANADLNALREAKSSSPDPASARAALAPRANARIDRFVRDVLTRWNAIVATNDVPGGGGRGYAAGMAVLNSLIAAVRAYKTSKGW